MDSALLLPLAHVGHWAFYVLYAVPVLVVIVSIVFTARRQRGEEDDEVTRSPGP